MDRHKMIIHKIYEKFKLAILFVNYLYVTGQQYLKKLPGNTKTVVFTLEDDRIFREVDGMGRYAYLILNAFANAGYSVYLYKRVDFKIFVRLGVFGRYMYLIKNLKIIDKLPRHTENMIYAFDTAVEDTAGHTWKKLIYFNHLKPPTCAFGDMINIPYFMHPNVYKSKQYDHVRSYRNNDRKMRIFFGGNINKKIYNFPNLQKYGQLTRLEGLKTVFQLGEHVRLKWNVQEFRQFLDQTVYSNQCILLKTDHLLKIKSKEWISIVSQGDFFLCLSGTDLPMCHNVIESMAVGTIPIISYPDWFFPALEHMKNAILYSGKEDLVKKIKDVLAMDKETIQEMRNNVIQFYDSHLSNSNFIKRIESNENKLNTMMLHPRLICDDKELTEGHRIFDEIRDLMEKSGKTINNINIRGR